MQWIKCENDKFVKSGKLLPEHQPGLVGPKSGPLNDRLRAGTRTFDIGKSG